jgi:hypothetical protein
MEKNNKKLLKLVREENHEFNLANVPNAFQNANLRLKAAALTPMAKHSNQVRNQGDNVSSLNEFQMTNSEITAEAKRRKMTPEALRAEYRDTLSYNAKAEMVQKVIGGGTLDADDENRLKEVGSNAAEIQKLVDLSLRNALILKLQRNEAPDGEDAALMKRLETTPDKLLQEGPKQ